MGTGLRITPDLTLITADMADMADMAGITADRIGGAATGALTGRSKKPGSDASGSFVVCCDGLRASSRTINFGISEIGLAVW
jgi:hypothetical protein